MLPCLDPWITRDHQPFRREVVYTPAIDEVLSAHEVSLSNIFCAFADSEGTQV